MLWRSLSSCQDLIHTFLSYRNQDLFYLTIFVCPRLLYAFITLAKLVALHSEDRRVGGTQPAALDSPSHPWNMVDFKNEVNYQQLAKKVLDKFTAISTDFIGADGRRDSMANAAAGIKMMIAGYERQTNELQTPAQSVEVSHPVEETSQEQPDTAGSAVYTCGQEVGDSNGTFDIDFTWDLPAETWWDDVLDSFTIVPYL